MGWVECDNQVSASASSLEDDITCAAGQLAIRICPNLHMLDLGVAEYPCQTLSELHEVSLRMDVRVDALDDEVGLQPNARLIKLEAVEPPIACPMRTLSLLIELTESTSR